MSIDLRMAIRNVSRNRRRSALTIIAIAFATTLLVFMLSWQLGSYATMINATVRLQSGHLQVQAKGYLDRKEMFLVVPKPERIYSILNEMPEVKGYTPRSAAFALVSSDKKTYGAAVIGVDPAREGSVSPLPTLVREGRFLGGENEAEAVVGYLLAKNLKVDLGGEVVLLGQGRDGSIAATAVKVTGLFESGQDSFDRSTIFLSLPFFKKTFAMGDSVHHVVILLASLDSVERVKRLLTNALAGMDGGGNLVVLDWKEIMPGLVQAIKMDLSSGFIFYIVLIIVVAFSIMNTFLMAVFERKREFGVLVAIGVKPKRLAKVLLMESFLITAVGVLLGIVMGSFVTLYFQRHGIELTGASDLLRQYGLPSRMYPKLSLLSVSIGSVLVFFITFVTALYPAVMATRIRPREAIARG